MGSCVSNQSVKNAEGESSAVIPEATAVVAEVAKEETTRKASKHEPAQYETSNNHQQKTESFRGKESPDKPEAVRKSTRGSEAAANQPAHHEVLRAVTTGGQDVKIDPGMFIEQQKAHLSDRYLRERKLGSGAYGEVLLCRDKQTGAERAVKIIKKSSVVAQASTSAILDEVSVLKQLDHPNIMKLYEFFEDKRHYYLVTEVYKGGELFDEIINRQRFSEVDAATIMKQVLSGVTYLHKYNIVHRDLKPENLLLESKHKDALIKIVDFGLSSAFDPNKKMKDRLGTAYYIAPEVLRKKYDEKCDVWSCGVVLYILLCGYPPFGGQTDQEILRRVEKGKFSFDPPEWTKVGDDVKDLIRQMLIYDPAKRISAEEALRCPWIQNMADQQNQRQAAADSPGLLNALGNMKKFHASQKLASAAMLFIGSKLTTVEETQELTKIFRKLDKNGDGQLDRKELCDGYSTLMQNGTLRANGESTPMSPEQIEGEVDKILDTVDFDKNGYIEYSEFVTVAMDRKLLLSRDRLQVAFNMFDQDASGKIASSELRRFLRDIDDESWNAIIREVDRNNDGEVDFEEFVLMMNKLV